MVLSSQNIFCVPGNKRRGNKGRIQWCDKTVAYGTTPPPLSLNIGGSRKLCKPSVIDNFVIWSGKGKMDENDILVFFFFRNPRNSNAEIEFHRNEDLMLLDFKSRANRWGGISDDNDSSLSWVWTMRCFHPVTNLSPRFRRPSAAWASRHRDQPSLKFAKCRTHRDVYR